MKRVLFCKLGKHEGNLIDAPRTVSTVMRRMPLLRKDGEATPWQWPVLYVCALDADGFNQDSCVFSLC